MESPARRVDATNVCFASVLAEAISGIPVISSPRAAAHWPIYLGLGVFPLAIPQGGQLRIVVIVRQPCFVDPDGLGTVVSVALTLPQA
jgi:hypothetical protein